MKRNNKYIAINIVFILLLLSANYTHAQSFEDKVVDVSAVAPVNFVSFNANKVNNDVVLIWKTASEINNSHFIVERSTNGLDFNSIGQITGNGSSNVINNYSFTDVNTPNVNMYYRLQQVDFNGSIKYSAIVLVRSSKSMQPTISIFPNPVQQNKANINFTNLESGIYTLRIKSVDGKNILSSVENIIANNHAIQLQFPASIQPGMYILLLSNSSGTVNFTQKIILQ